MPEDVDVPGAGLDAARALLGQQVVVRLTDSASPDKVLVEGRLLSVSDSGEIVTQDEMGFTSWSWPMLDIAPAPVDSP